MDDGTPVFANVELAGRKLIVEVNRAARAERALTQMGEWLGDCVSAPMAEIRTLDRVMAEDDARQPQDEALDLPMPEIESTVVRNSLVSGSGLSGRVDPAWRGPIKKHTHLHETTRL